MSVIPASLVGGILISIEYPANGLDWARLYDNPILGWNINDTGTPPPAPVIIGQLPTAAAATAPILSPQWAIYLPETDGVLVPDIYRNRADLFFNWLATNNGAHRPIQTRLAFSIRLFNAYTQWAVRNPTLASSA